MRASSKYMVFTHDAHSVAFCRQGPYTECSSWNFPHGWGQEIREAGLCPPPRLLPAREGQGGSGGGRRGAVQVTLESV